MDIFAPEAFKDAKLLSIFNQGLDQLDMHSSNLQVEYFLVCLDERWYIQGECVSIKPFQGWNHFLESHLWQTQIGWQSVVTLFLSSLPRFH